VGVKGRDYIYTLVPLLEDALTDKDVVHRQLGIQCVKHIVLSVKPPALDLDLLVHFLNLIFPNVFEDNVYLKSSYDACIEALALRLGSDILYKYIVQGLYHPARKVRERYREIYFIVENIGYNGMAMNFCREKDSLMDFNVLI
jgi:splicing factor 3B subunit 1